MFCPNAGLLSGVVLSLIPLLLPFHWQCLLLPVLPAAEGRLELMEVRGAAGRRAVPAVTYSKQGRGCPGQPSRCTS